MPDTQYNGTQLAHRFSQCYNTPDPKTPAPENTQHDCTIEDAHNFAQNHFDDAYSVDHRQFADGTDRIVIVHHLSISPTERIDIKIWYTRDEVSLKYVLHDETRYHANYDLDDLNLYKVMEYWTCPSPNRAAIGSDARHDYTK